MQVRTTRPISVVISKAGRILVRGISPWGMWNWSRDIEGGTRQHKDGRTSFAGTDHNVRVFNREFPDSRCLEIWQTHQGNKNTPDIQQKIAKSPYESTTLPYPYQDDILSRMKIAEHRHHALFCEQGTGKTKIAIDWAGTLFQAELIRHALVVAPNMVHKQWVTEQIPLHHGFDYAAVPWDASPAKRKKLTRESLGLMAGLQWTTINYEALRTAKGHAFLAERLQDHPFLLIFDESHRAKNVQTQVWKACKALSENRHCEWRLLLTGTPIAKNLVDEWAQLKLLDEGILGIRYLGTFRNEYCVMGGYEGRQIVGYRNHEVFKRRTAPYVIRATKDKLAGLPEKMYSRYEFDMEKSQQRMYKQMLQDMLVQLQSGEVATAANAAVLSGKLQQISNGFLHSPASIADQWDDDNILDTENNPRIKALYDVLDQGEGRAIIWCRYHQDIEIISHSKIAPQCVYYHGNLPAATREESIAAWKDDKSGKNYLVATPGSAGTGLNLQICNRAIYYSNSENSIQRWQSEDRIHRIGASGDHCLYIDLIARGSRDIKILQNLREKKDLSDLTLDGIRQDWESTLMELDAIE